jgi:hypothetical protein
MGHKAYAGLGLVAVSLAALVLGGCASVAGEQEANVNFKVKQNSAGEISWRNRLTVVLGPVSVSDALLTGVTLTTVDPPDTPDLTYISSLLGEGVGPDGQVQPFCTGGNFPAGQPSAETTVLFTGNIIPFFDATNSLHLTWTGLINESYTGTFPPDGFKVAATLHVDPQ